MIYDFVQKCDKSRIRVIFLTNMKESEEGCSTFDQELARALQADIESDDVKGHEVKELTRNMYPIPCNGPSTFRVVMDLIPRFPAATIHAIRLLDNSLYDETGVNVLHLGNPSPLAFEAFIAAFLDSRPSDRSCDELLILIRFTSCCEQGSVFPDVDTDEFRRRALYPLLGYAAKHHETYQYGVPSLEQLTAEGQQVIEDYGEEFDRLMEDDPTSAWAGMCHREFIHLRTVLGGELVSP
jgi:hypothetical protein